MSPPKVSGSSRLPLSMTRLFGRDAETARLEELIPDSPVLTLTGAPGCGKTRLGVEVAARLAARFADGTCFVDLTPLADERLVADELAGELEIDEDPGLTRVDTLANQLGVTDLLVVLDNCERVAAGVALLVERLVAACPALRFIATSRVALGVPGERVWRVPPLTTESAIELFADRAGLASSDFRIADMGPAIEQICRGLDGLPLAIELVAAWTRVLSPAQILERLETALPLLRYEARPGSRRQITMEATVDWSYQLLTPSQQELFDQLSVFAASFDIDAAAAASGRADVLGDLTSLVDHSLMQAQASSDALMRYRLLEPVRQCGAAKLAKSGDPEAVRSRHAEHYLRVAQECDAAVRGPDRAVALRRLETEEGNVLAALEWAWGQPGDLALRICAAMAHYWEVRGRINDARAWLARALDRPDGDPRLRSTGLARAARLAWRQRDYCSARELLEVSLAIERELGDELRSARRLRLLAVVVMSSGSPREAEKLCHEAIAIMRSHGDRHALGWALIHLGWARHLAGNVDGGNRAMNEALASSQKTGNVKAASASLHGLAHGAHSAGDLVAARSHFVASLELLRAAGELGAEPDWLWAAAALAADEGRAASALRLAGGAKALSRRLGSRINEQFMMPLEPRLQRVRRLVGDEAAERLLAEGARMGPEQLLAEAVAEAEPPAPERFGGGLTRREQEVAELVARGFTNGEIATKLFISKRTVESHVEHIRQKLGHSSRAELIAWGLRELAVTNP